MAVISLRSMTVPDQYENDAKIVLAQLFGYSEFVPDTNGDIVPNPEDPILFTELYLKDHIINGVKSRLRQAAAKTAAEAEDVSGVDITV